MSVIRTTLITAVKEMQDLKLPVTTKGIQDHLGVRSTKISGNLWQAVKDGLIGTKTVNGEKIWIATKKSMDYLRTTKDLPLNTAELEAHFNGTSPIKVVGAPKKTQRYGAQASSAINSIADLIDHNEKLTTVLRSIRSQINLVLAEENTNEQSN